MSQAHSGQPAAVETGTLSPVSAAPAAQTFEELCAAVERTAAERVEAMQAVVFAVDGFLSLPPTVPAITSPQLRKLCDEYAQYVRALALYEAALAAFNHAPAAIEPEWTR